MKAEMILSFIEGWTFWTYGKWALLALGGAMLMEALFGEKKSKDSTGFTILFVLASFALLAIGLIFVPYNWIFGKKAPVADQTTTYSEAAQTGNPDRTSKNNFSSADAKKDSLAQTESFSNYFDQLSERHKLAINLLPRKVKSKLVSKINNSASLDGAKTSSERGIKSAVIFLSRNTDLQLDLATEYNKNVELINKLIPVVEKIEAEVIRMRQFTGPETIAEMEYQTKVARISANTLYRECDIYRQKIIEAHESLLKEGYYDNIDDPLIHLPSKAEELAAVRAGKAPLSLSGMREQVMLVLNLNKRRLYSIEIIKSNIKSLINEPR